MLRRLVYIVAAAMLAATGNPAFSQSTDYVESLRKLQQLDARVQSIGWRLAQGNARFCAETRPAIGLLIQDIMGYNRPAEARSALAVSADFAVQAVAGGSPADSAGLQANQPIAAIDGQNLSEMVDNAKAPFLRLQWVESALQIGLDKNGVIALSTPGKAEPIAVSSVPICNARFVVRTSNHKAAADAKAVYIGGKFPGIAYAEDGLAAAMAHELAHVLLRHPQWLSENGRKRRDIRATEREADKMMPWLLANAGYAPEAATRFMQRWGREEDSGLLKLRRTHDGWDERIELIEAELPLVRAAMDRDGFADWSARFPRKPAS